MKEHIPGPGGAISAVVSNVELGYGKEETTIIRKSCEWVMSVRLCLGKLLREARYRHDLYFLPKGDLCAVNSVRAGGARQPASSKGCRPELATWIG